MRSRPCLVALVLVLTACGDDDDPASVDGGEDRDVATDRTVDRDGARGDAMGDDADAGDDADDSPDCGDPGQPCCVASACRAGGCCVDALCVASGANCGGALGTCMEGSCGGCGALGEACCLEHQSDGCGGGMSDPPRCHGCTAPGARCSVLDPSSEVGIGTCEACGHEDEQCCRVQECIEELAYCATHDAAPSTCSVACGHPGEPCCQGRTCRDEGCCVYGGSEPEQCVIGPVCGDLVDATPDGPVACGDIACGEGQLCLDTALVNRAGTTHTYRCATMPTACAGTASCGCAATLCELLSNGSNCSDGADSTLTCSILTP